jgi:hypothetical protein
MFKAEQYNLLKSYLRLRHKQANEGLRALVGAGTGGLVGAGLGAGGGLLREAFFVKPEEAQYLRRALQGLSIGGLAGASLGAGIGASSVGKHIQTALEEYGSRANIRLLQNMVNFLNAVKVKNLPPFINKPEFYLDPEPIKLSNNLIEG